jgi:1-acyl-sn-glycerol-3-phosphate acyltransferase
MTALRSLLFNAVFYGWTAVIVVAGLPLLLAPRIAMYYLGRAWAHPILCALAVICGLRHEVRGRENLPEGAVLIAAKHQSAWDTIIFSILLWDHSFVLKKELLRIPLFGLLLWRAGLIPVDRSGGAGASPCLNQVQRASTSRKMPPPRCSCCSMPSRNSVTPARPAAASAPSRVSPRAAPKPETRPARNPWFKVRWMQRIPTGPTGMAMARPMARPFRKIIRQSTASTSRASGGESGAGGGPSRLSPIYDMTMK